MTDLISTEPLGSGKTLRRSRNMATSRIASMARFAMSLPEGPTRADIIRIVVAMAMAKDAGAALDKHAAEQFLAGLMKQKQEKVQSGIRRDAAPYDNALREHGFDSDDPMTELMRGRLWDKVMRCLLYTSPSPRDKRQSRMPSSA